MEFKGKKRRLSDFSKERNLKEKNEFRKNVIRSNDLPRFLELIISYVFTFSFYFFLARRQKFLQVLP
jgi:hypothetical protein